ncbi:MAG: hypothetical protein NTU62_04585 [Spirochaetes bacterium]|nr:hypothetical protein [Spirochaetota bacterium]
MRSLRRTACALLACGLLAPLAPAQTRAAFDKIVDFSVTLKTLSAAAAGEAVLPANRLLLLEGTISEIVVLDDRPKTWRVRVELMAGEWIGVDEVRGYRCWVTFAGPGYADVFPAEVPDAPSPDYLPLHSRVLVLARALSPAVTPLGEKVMTVEGLAVRMSR